MQQAQLGAAHTVCRVLQGRNLDQSLAAAWQELSRLTTQQRGSLQDLSYGTLRFYGQLSAILDRLLHKPVKDAQLRCLLLVALYQLLYTKASPYTIVDQAVRATQTLKPEARGLVNAILRNFQRNREASLAASEQTERGRYSYPQWWIDEIKQQYGERARAVLLAGNQRPPMSLRVNRRRITPSNYLSLLAQHDMQASVVGPEAILLERPVAIDKLPGFAEGLVSVQDAGAQYAAHLLDVRDGIRVLDACAAPGGKTAHLLELAKVDMLALDKDALRTEKIHENLERLGLTAQVQQGDASNPDGWWDGRQFQRILVDAPCSASGVVRRHPDIKWLRRDKDIVGFSQQQARILATMWQLLESDGKLLYATCSVFRQENQQVIEQFLCQHGNARQLSLTIPGAEQGQLLPNDQHDGFFYSLLHKQG